MYFSVLVFDSKVVVFVTQVRATNLQELVYKNGQAGVTKATVSITFDNSNKQHSPMGYEVYDEITVTRQVHPTFSCFLCCLLCSRYACHSLVFRNFAD